MSAPAIVTWLWGAKYSERHVEKLHEQIQAKTSVPFRFFCITDRARIPGVSCIPLPGKDRRRNRLWFFSQQAADLIGAPMLALDIDMVVTGDLAPFLTEQAKFRIWKSESIGRHGFAYNPSLMFRRPPYGQSIWKRWGRDPAWVQRNAEFAGWYGKEQAVIGYFMHIEKPAVWTDQHGVYSARELEDPVDLVIAEPPSDARIVSFHGRKDPADKELHVRAPWLKQYWG